jgi:alpha-beta hydrolase superfamily lysophospholipase
MPLTGSAALPSAGANWLVLYHSKSVDGRDVAVSGTIAIPPGSPPEGGWPVTTWGHGTTGVGPACAPSKDTPSGPEHGFLEPKQVLMDDYVRRGYVVAATDYEGLGGPAVHPFLQGASEAHGALDIVRAARQIEPRIGVRYLAIGHSQGGHADLFTAALGADYVPELKLVGNVAMAPASHIVATIEGMAAATQPSYALGYAMYVLQSFSSNHPEVDLSRILTPTALEHLPQTRVDCISKTVSEGYWAIAIPKDQILSDADLGPILAIAAANEPGTLTIPVPTFVAQGTKDTTVLPSWTDATVRDLCRNGVAVQYIVYPGADHETIVSRSTSDVKSWIDARFAGVTADSNCAALPTAGLQ